MAWGDDKDDKMPELPERYESEPDADGIREITTWRKNELGQLVKKVEKVKVTKVTVKVSRTVLARRKWAKFGEEKGKPSGYHGRGWSEVTTQVDLNEQLLEMNPKQQIQEETNESAQRAFDKLNATAFEAWRPKNRGEDNIEAAKEWALANGLPSGGDDGPRLGGGDTGSLAALAARTGGGSGYVPPSLRNADGSRNTEMSERDDSCTVRCSNLSEDVKDSDLRELFRRFGAIQRVYLAKDRETQQSRGFAFINFFARDDAQKAINALDGHGYDHLILSVSWANPSAAKPGQAAPPTGAAFGPPVGGGPPGERPKFNLQPAGGGGGKSDIASRFDSHVFDPGLDRFR